MRIAIVEDEKIHQNYLTTMLENASEIEGLTLSLHIFETAENFLFNYEDNTFDVILLDIMLDEMNGFSLAEKIREKNPLVPIAFITGEKDYVFDGYKVDACSYILKPIKQDSINQLMLKLKDKVNMLEKPMAIKTKDGLINVYQSSINYIESDNHSTIICTSKEQYVTSYKMKEWDDMLNHDNFFKTHRCYIVGLRNIDRIDKKHIIINEEVIPIARGKWEPLMQAYMKFRRKDY